MSTRLPKYRLHKGSGQALVQIEGQRIYLGVHGTRESKEKYRRHVAEWLATRRPPSQATSGNHTSGGLSINELILSYWRFAESYYSKDGQPTKELTCMREALRPLRRLYGNTPADAFGPKGLKTVRQHMVGQSLSRGLVNRRVGRIKRVFKWAVAEELVSPSIHHALQAVTGLRHGRTKAREAEPVKPVEDKWWTPYCHTSRLKSQR